MVSQLAGGWDLPLCHWCLSRTVLRFTLVTSQADVTVGMVDILPQLQGDVTETKRDAFCQLVTLSTPILRLRG